MHKWERLEGVAIRSTALVLVLIWALLSLIKLIR
jgi:hypothetical protein